MIILQTPWKPRSLYSDIAHVLEKSLSQVHDPSGELVLLPHVNGYASDVSLREESFFSIFSKVSREFDIFISTSAYINELDGKVKTIGYLFNPNGEMIIRAPKILPDLLEGFSDTTCSLDKKSKFDVAMTKEGQVGVLCSEDILSPHFSRSLVLNGAEIILNPSREWSDKNFAIRQMARQARSYENLAYVACSSSYAFGQGDRTINLPSATSVSEMWGTKITLKSNESFLIADIDIQALRKRREEPMGNFPAIVRTDLYASSLKSDESFKKLPALKKDWLKFGKDKIKSMYPKGKLKDVSIARYDVLLAQTVTHVSSNPNNLVSFRKKNLENAISVAKPFSMSDSIKLIVFPEFFLTGAVSQLGSDSSGIVDKIGITFPGYEADILAKFAQDTKSYVSGGVFEYDPSWPKRFFNSAFIFDDNGNLIHLYRKIHCADVFGRLPDTTPGSIYTEYVDRYGYDHLFPVAKTPLGNLSTVICFDMNFGETHREMVRRGAEIIIHPTSEPHNIRRRGWDIARHVRAYENTAYILTAGHGGEFRSKGLSDFPTHMNRGYSKIVNFDGSLQCVADGPGALPLIGSINLESLRRERSNIKNNLLVWDNPDVYSEFYNKGKGIVNDLWKDKPERNPYVNNIQINKNIEMYQREKIYIPSDKFNQEQLRDQSDTALV